MKWRILGIWLITTISCFAQFSGGSGSGYANPILSLTACQLFLGGDGSGGVFDTLAAFPSPCKMYLGDSLSGYSSSIGTFTNCPSFLGNQASGYNTSSQTNSFCPEYFGASASGYSSTFITCTPFATTEVTLQARWLSTEDVRLDWKAHFPEPISYYILERSTDGNLWEALSLLPEEQDYFIDANVPKNADQWWYRVWSYGISVNSVSNWVMLQRKEQYQINIFPNPILAQEKLNIELLYPKPFPVTLVLYNALGEEVFAQELTQTHSQIPLNLDAGIYWGRIYYAQTKVHTFRLLILRH